MMKCIGLKAIHDFLIAEPRCRPLIDNWLLLVRAAEWGRIEDLPKECSIDVRSVRECCSIVFFFFDGFFRNENSTLVYMLKTEVIFKLGVIKVESIQSVEYSNATSEKLMEFS
jgi:hypothetical protein